MVRASSLAVGLIVEYIPNGVRRIISPFIGGGERRNCMRNRVGFRSVGL